MNKIRHLHRSSSCRFEIRRGDAYSYLSNGLGRFYPNVTQSTYRRLLYSNSCVFATVFVRGPVSRARYRAKVKLDAVSKFFNYAAYKNGFFVFSFLENLALFLYYRM